MNYWLFKSEPAAFSIDHLAAAPKHVTAWDGVRNFQARNMLRDLIKKGDLGFFYHSSCATPGITGVVNIIKGGYPDKTAFDPNHHHYDIDSEPLQPRWFVVDIKLKIKFKQIITLDQLRKYENTSLRDLLILRRGNRLSVTPVSQKNWEFVLTLI